MTRKYRKRVDAATKIASLRRHVVDKVPVSEICEELGVQPSVFYTWQKELFLRGASVELPRLNLSTMQKVVA